MIRGAFLGYIMQRNQLIAEANHSSTAPRSCIWRKAKQQPQPRQPLPKSRQLIYVCACKIRTLATYHPILYSYLTLPCQTAAIQPLVTVPAMPAMVRRNLQCASVKTNYYTGDGMAFCMKTYRNCAGEACYASILCTCRIYFYHTFYI